MTKSPDMVVSCREVKDSNINCSLLDTEKEYCLIEV